MTERNARLPVCLTPDDFEGCAAYLKALGEPIRFRIVCILRTGPLTVSEIAERLQLDLATVSHHLRVLFHHDLVTIEKDGKYSYYGLNKAFIRESKSVDALDFGCCILQLRG